MPDVLCHDSSGCVDVRPAVIQFDESETVHELESWGEGTTGAGGSIGGTGQGSTANPGDATWNARMFPGTLWTTPGGDHDAIASATLSVTSVINNPYTWLSTPGLVSDVQGWLDTPATNFGWEVINLDARRLARDQPRGDPFD